MPHLARSVALLCWLVAHIVCSTCFAAEPVPTLPSDRQRPNVLLILADDLGYGDIRCYNPDRGKIPTPRLDSLAAAGLRFTDAHSSSGVCSPSRYALLTGRYHWRTRLQRGIVGVWDKPLIAEKRLTVAQLAADQGYRTACVGKWHLGNDWNIPDQAKSAFQQLARRNGQPFTPADVTEDHRRHWREVLSRPIAGGPTTRGFHRYFGTDVPNWPPYAFISDDKLVGLPTTVLHPELFRNHQASLQGPALEGWSFEKILPALTDEACRFIADTATSRTPFLLYLPLTTPHTPLAVNAEWRGRSGLDSPVADLIMETDAAVGRVLDALDNSGVADNTLVVFSSDNGFASYVGAKHLESQGHYPSGPLRGYKADVYEGGHRVPFLVRWPGVVRPGAVADQLVHHADVLPTLAEIFGKPLPPDAAEDGFSLLPILRGGQTPPREWSVSCAADGTPSVRHGSWKLVLQPTPELYDLATDPRESRDLAPAEPQRVADMRAHFEQLITRGRSNPGPPQQNDVPVVRYPRKETRSPAKSGS